MKMDINREKEMDESVEEILQLFANKKLKLHEIAAVLYTTMYNTLNEPSVKEILEKEYGIDIERTSAKKVMEIQQDLISLHVIRNET